MSKNNDDIVLKITDVLKDFDIGHLSNRCLSTDVVDNYSSSVISRKQII